VNLWDWKLHTQGDGRESGDVMVDRFKGYLAASDQEFQQYVKKQKKSTYSLENDSTHNGRGQILQAHTIIQDQQLQIHQESTIQ